MTEEHPPLLTHKTKHWSEWVKAIENLDFLKASQEEHGNGTLLPRQDITLYGIYPKMEARVYISCKDCLKLIPSTGVKGHFAYYHTNKKPEEASSSEVAHSSSSHSSTTTNSTSVKKKSSHSKSKKKSIVPKNVPLPLLLPKSAGHISLPVTISTVKLPSPILHSVQVESAAASLPPAVNDSASINKSHKKHKKPSNNNKTIKDHHHDKDKHKSATDNHKVIVNSVKSATSSNHQFPSPNPPNLIPACDTFSLLTYTSLAYHMRLQRVVNCWIRKKNTIEWKKVSLKKVVPSRTKTFNHLSENKELGKSSATALVAIAPKSAPENVTRLGQSDVVVTTTSLPVKTVTELSMTTVDVKPSSAESDTPPSTVVVKPVVTAPLINESKTVVDFKLSQENASNISTIPKVLIPMSPVSVISPLQLIQVSVPVLNLPGQACAPGPSRPIILSIPEQFGGIDLCSAHPRPLLMPSLATRRIRGTFLLQGPRKPTKRPATERLVGSDRKLRRDAPDVNGFVLHADVVSEAAEAPQMANNVHDKILLNM